MQGAFHLLRPTLGLAKTVALIDRAANDEFLDGFLALETWGNDNISFPGKCYERYIEELYRKDALAKGEFTLSGKEVKLANIDMPVLSITFEHDNIVPVESAAKLGDLISSKDKTILRLPGGHVGAVVSKSAQKRLWPMMMDFWAKRDAEPAPVVIAPAPTSETTVKTEKADKVDKKVPKAPASRPVRRKAPTSPKKAEARR
jgi:polyhydroxyalkanoate synthase